MQPESCHHAQDPFAQGLGPYTEIPAKLADKAAARAQRYGVKLLLLQLVAAGGNVIIRIQEM